MSIFGNLPGGWTSSMDAVRPPGAAGPSTPPVADHHSQSEAAFQLGDVVRNKWTGAVLTVTGPLRDWEPYYYELVRDDVVGVPEREPEPGSWIDRNLTPPDRSDDDTEMARVRAAVDSLGNGTITVDDLARVGVTQEQFDRLCDEDIDRDAAEYHAQRSAELDAAALGMTTQQARELVREADEIQAHLAGCHQDVGQCTTCSAQEHGDGSFWTIDVPAARQRIAELDTDTATTTEQAENSGEVLDPLGEVLAEPEPSALSAAVEEPTVGATDANELDLATAIELVAADTREGVDEPDMSDAAAIAMTVAEVSHDDVRGAVDDPALRDAYLRVLDTDPTEIAAHLGDEDGVIAAAVAPLVPEREPEPDSWIAHNLPAFPSAGALAADAMVAEQRGQRLLDALDALPEPTREQRERWRAEDDAARTDTDSVLDRIDEVLAEPEPASRWAHLGEDVTDADVEDCHRQYEIQRACAAADQEAFIRQLEREDARDNAEFFAELDRVEFAAGSEAATFRADTAPGQIGGEPPPLAAEVTECGRAVEAASEAVCCAEVAEEDTDRAERLAGWNDEDATETEDADQAADERGLE